jgi:hypothetical protein
MNKQEVLDVIDHFPDPIDPEQLMTALYLKAKLDRAEAAVARGEVVSHEEVVQRSRQWFDRGSQNLPSILENR